MEIFGYFFPIHIKIMITLSVNFPHLGRHTKEEVYIRTNLFV